jgi:hypothetical protein
LKHTEIVEKPGEQVPLSFEAVPYKVRTAIERKARLLSGYCSGISLADEFMTVLNEGGDNALPGVDALIAKQNDPRRREILEELKTELGRLTV